MSNEELVQRWKYEKRTRYKQKQSSAHATRDLLSFVISALRLTRQFLPPSPIVPRAEIVLSSRQDPERKIGAGSKSSSRILARKSLDKRKRFGLFNPLKRMATRSIEERKLGQGRGNGQHLFGNHPLPPPPLFFPLSPILPTFFYHPRLSLSLRQREFLFSFPTIKLKAKDHFLPDVCSTLLRRPFRSRSRIWVDFETREFLSSRNWKRKGIFLEYF